VDLFLNRKQFAAFSVFGKPFPGMPDESRASLGKAAGLILIPLRDSALLPFMESLQVFAFWHDMPSEETFGLP